MAINNTDSTKTMAWNGQFFPMGGSPTSVSQPPQSVATSNPLYITNAFGLTNPGDMIIAHLWVTETNALYRVTVLETSGDVGQGRP